MSRPLPPSDPDPLHPERDRAIGIVMRVDGCIERRIWNPADIESKIMMRSPEEILQDGHVCFATPCFDLTSVTAELLRESGLPPTLVISRMKRLFQPTGLQVGIEVELDGEPHIIGFGRSSKRCQRGRYEIVGARRAVHRRLLEGETFRASHLSLFGLSSYQELPSLLDGYRPTLHIRRFQRMQRLSRWRWARRQAHKKAEERRPGHIPSPGRWGEG
ncbi:MAG: hypothetical protein O7H41_01050 [Planctomycetota bacterium]|nr:hypothetical protein [Planctomycetota bacterium]